MYLPTIYIFEDYESTNCYVRVIKSQINAETLGGEFKECIQGILQHYVKIYDVKISGPRDLPCCGE